MSEKTQDKEFVLKEMASSPSSEFELEAQQTKVSLDSMALNTAEVSQDSMDSQTEEVLQDSVDSQTAEVSPNSMASPDADVRETSHSVPGFRDLELIAKGASGHGFSAKRSSDNRVVALKIYQKELTPDSESIKRFEHEVVTLKRLTHPNIVKILSSGTTDFGESYIEMEYVEGDSLRKILDRTGRFAAERAVLVAREICRALTAAHESGIVHRDLKPNNIILDEHNIAKVVDFGVAKAVGSSNDTITKYGAIIGTPAYMSPEQCLGQLVDERSDIYSLGCTLFELLTKVKAFEAETAITALAKQINKDRGHLKPILEQNQIPPQLQRIVLKCLEREPDMRYKSAAALDQDLSAYLLQVQQRAFGLDNMTPLTQIVLCVCGIIAVLVIFETMVLNARATLEASHAPPPTLSLSQPSNLQPTSASTLIEIKNRLTGAVIFSEKSPRLTLKNVIQDATLKGVSLANADLRNANLVQATLSGVDLQNADLSGAQFTQSHLNEVKFDNAILTKAVFTQARIDRCSFRNARMSSATLIQTKAPGSDFRDADLTMANLTQAQLQNADLRSADLSGANCVQAGLRGANITYAKLPTQGRYSDIDVHGCIMNGVTLP